MASFYFNLRTIKAFNCNLSSSSSMYICSMTCTNLQIDASPKRSLADEKKWFYATERSLVPLFHRSRNVFEYLHRKIFTPSHHMP